MVHLVLTYMGKLWYSNSYQIGLWRGTVYPCSRIDSDSHDHSNGAPVLPYHLTLPDSKFHYRYTKQTEPLTSTFCSISNGNPRMSRRIDKLKQKLVDMLCGSFSSHET